jgi:abequosyltransferase
VPDGPLLSICIPTHNFGRFIGQTLSSVLTQVTEEVEIVVLDGGSTDDTRSVVTALQRHNHQIRYIFQAERGGIDRDIARVVECASGSYCWLLSADDIMLPGALATVLEIVRRGSDDVILGAHSNHTIDMALIAERHPIFRTPIKGSVDLSSRGNASVYFRSAQTTEAFFSFMSTLVIKRRKWLSIAFNEEFAGSCWSHAVRIFDMAPQGLSVNVADRVLVGRRGDNDSFLTHGVVRRMALAIDGYIRIANRLWGPCSEEAFHVRRVLRNEFPLRFLLATKASCQPEEAAPLALLVGRLYCDPRPGVIASRLLFRMTPISVLPALKALYRLFTLAFKPRLTGR